MTEWDRSFEQAFQQSMAHHQSGQLTAAEQGYRHILLSFPEEPRALHLLGVIALQTGHLDEAEELLRRALRHSPDSAETCSNLGLVLAAGSRIHEAGEWFKRAVELDPRYAAAHYNFGLALECTTGANAAIASYRRAIELKPDYADALCNLAIVLHGAGQQAEAATLYRRALAVRPDLPRLDVYLGAALAELGDAKGAQAAFDTALHRNPHDPLVPFCRAHLAYESSDIDGSLELLRVALQRLAASDALAVPTEPVGARPPVYAVERYAEALRAATEHLTAAGIDAFLIGGTLLAARREGRFFAHDKDVDLAVMEDVTPAMLDAALLDSPDFTRVRPPTDNEMLPAYWFRDFVVIDVFRFFREADHLWCGVPVNGHRLQWLHRPFRLVDMDWLGITVKVPEDPNYFLTECYGDDWRTPNPYFAMWASPNLKGGFPSIARCLAYGQIFRAACTGRRNKALNLCAQALRLDANDRLILTLRDRLLAAPQSAAAAEPAIPQTLGHAFEDLPG
jgi:tetratricopeptide (TPR) repeat protein